MMIASRYLCAVVVLIVASLTPSSCSDVGEPAMALEKPEEVVSDEAVEYSRMQGAKYEIDLSADADPQETGS